MSDKQQGVIMDGVFVSFDDLRSIASESLRIYRVVGPNTRGAQASKTILTLLDHIEAQQGERQAFVDGAEWRDEFCSRRHCGKGDCSFAKAQAEAAKRYPAARPQVTREMVATVIDRCVFYDPDTRGGIGGADEAVSEIMRLIGGQNA